MFDFDEIRAEEMCIVFLVEWGICWNPVNIYRVYYPRGNKQEHCLKHLRSYFIRHGAPGPSSGACLPPLTAV